MQVINKKSIQGAVSQKNGRDFEIFNVKVLNDKSSVLYLALQAILGIDLSTYIAIKSKENSTSDITLYSNDPQKPCIRISAKAHNYYGHLQQHLTVKDFFLVFSKAFPGIHISPTIISAWQKNIGTTSYYAKFNQLSTLDQLELKNFVEKYAVELIDFLYFYDKGISAFIDGLLINKGSFGAVGYIPQYFSRQEVMNYVKNKMTSSNFLTINKSGFIKIPLVIFERKRDKKNNQNFRPSTDLQDLSKTRLNSVKLADKALIQQIINPGKPNMANNTVKTSIPKTLNGFVIATGVKNLGSISKNLPVPAKYFGVIKSITKKKSNVNSSFSASFHLPNCGYKDDRKWFTLRAKDDAQALANLDLNFNYFKSEIKQIENKFKLNNANSQSIRALPIKNIKRRSSIVGGVNIEYDNDQEICIRPNGDTIIRAIT